MITMSVGELKPHFSEVLDEVRNGENVIISYGRKKEKVAVIIPYSKYSKKKMRKSSLVENSSGDGKNHELDSFIGTWVEDSEFDDAIKAFETVDQELWK